jgi:hypothetical protein
MTKAKHPWNPTDEQILIDMKECQHASWTSIGARLGRPPSHCAQRYGVLCVSRERAPIKTVAEIAEAKYDGRFRQILDRAQALNDARTLRDDEALRRGHCTPAFFGDPPPGRSALDRKRAAA